MQQWQAVRRRTESLLRALGSERPFARRGDLVLVLVLLAPSAFNQEGLATALAAWLTACLLITAAVVVQRTVPLLSLLLAGLLALFYPWFGASLWPTVAAAVLSFLAGRRLTRLLHAHLVFLCVAVACLVLVSAFADAKDWLSLLMTEFASCVLPWWAGNWWSQRTALAHAGWEHAEQLEWKQRYIAEQARLKERARIAQDIHDSLGHELSVMALLAGGLELAPSLSAEHRDAVGQLRERCTMATERLHDVIGLLREDPTPSLTPAHESIAQLVRRFEQSATPVHFHEEGAPSVAGKPLLSDLAAYRVVQESLTNAAKHAPGAPIAVRVTHGTEETVVSVVNERPENDESPPAAGSGSGLIGLDERVRLAGGTLRTGPRAGGFEVRARLPHTASAPSRATASPDHDAAWPQSGADAGTDATGPAIGGAVSAPPSPWRSTSRTALLRTRARLRRDARRAALIPALLGVGIVTLLGGLYVFTSATTSVSPEDYARIRLGETRAELEPVLPSRRIKKPPPVVSEPVVPQGATCEYYRASASLLQFTDTMYRLCFEDDVLMTKDTL
ncbi:sensor histidine kinase [Streptomyces turgidiscabies]|uniref:histidine kinase n=1 Tax=Streptomyces turgidiscabies TaxID=85558 RepID=A0ABU0S018_9ACTN|nr:histidine kinase [Streptomyces turgidiscabies]MDQ0937551.1 signal transduction histidine kinase [Streptomyces turgidiscabies]